MIIKLEIDSQLFDSQKIYHLKTTRNLLLKDTNEKS